MPSDMLIKLESITGESAQDGFTDYIEMESFSWGASNTATFGTGSTGGGIGKAGLSDFSFTKYLDKATVGIGKALMLGTHLKSATIALRKSGGGETSYTYVTITLTEVVVTTQQFGGGGGGQVAESISLAFKSIKFDYSTQADGGAVSSIGNFSYDVTTGKPLAGK